jgi:hypothetical protein
MLTYRKTKNGKWVAFGPQSEVRKGWVKITTKAGKVKTEFVESTGRSFDVNGVQHCYGYLAPKSHRYSEQQKYAAEDGGKGGCCAECGRPGATILCEDSSGITGYCCYRCASYAPYERSFA